MTRLVVFGANREPTDLTVPIARAYDEFRGMSWATITLGEYFTTKLGFAFICRHFGASSEHMVLTPENFHRSGGFRARSDSDHFYTVEPGTWVSTAGRVAHGGDNA